MTFFLYLVRSLVITPTCQIQSILSVFSVLLLSFLMFTLGGKDRGRQGAPLYKLSRNVPPALKGMVYGSFRSDKTYRFWSFDQKLDMYCLLV